MPENTMIANGVKILGEYVLPGGSLMLEGRVGAGLLHTAAGVVALSLLGPIAGPIGRLLVSANAFSASVGHRNVFDAAVGPSPAAPEPASTSRATSTSRSS
jgi:Family of unknown function (DUF6072)